MPPFSLIYKGGIFLYPIPNNENFKRSDKYLWYDGFEKEGISYIEADKNIFVHESCVNLSQEDHSQYIPFEMERYYHGIDLMDMMLQIYFVNSQMGANFSDPINVEYDDYRIRFGWLVDRNATAVSGTLMFEVRAIGTVPYEGQGTGQDLSYVWKSHTNSQITILKSLVGETTFVPTEDWYTKLITTVNKQTNDTLVYKQEAAESAKKAKASEQVAINSENAAKGHAADIRDSANAAATNASMSEASAQRSEESAELAKSWTEGGTNTRPGEDTNNAKFYCQAAQDIVDTLRTDVTNNTANLNIEVSRAKAAESALSDRIDAEKTRAESAEGTLTTNLASEVTRATNAENALQNKIDNEAARVRTTTSNLSTRITAEESRAVSAENALSDRIDAENTRAMGAESVLTTNLNAISTALSEETSRAVGVENTLSTRVTNVENAVSAKADQAEVDSSLELKANAADVVSALEGKADSDHTHTYIYIGTETPTDDSVVLWVDTVNGLKYRDGSAWVNVPMATS